MPNIGCNTRAKCPYFKRIKGNAIICEGVTSESLLILMFDKPEQRDAWQKMTCEEYDYKERCPVAEMMERKYEAEEQQAERTAR